MKETNVGKHLSSPFLASAFSMFVAFWGHSHKGFCLTLSASVLVGSTLLYTVIYLFTLAIDLQGCMYVWLTPTPPLWLLVS